MDDTIDTTDLEKLVFFKRVPLGIYRFSILEPSEAYEPKPTNKVKSQMRRDFQIDHIKPMSQDGLTYDREFANSDKIKLIKRKPVENTQGDSF